MRIKKKEAQSMFEYAIPYITNYCGKINENGGFGDRYNLVSDHRTINFSMNGGFSALYKNQEEKSVKDKEKESLLIRISKLQEDDLLHKKKIRSQNTIIRIWQIASAIFAIISGLSIFLKY